MDFVDNDIKSEFVFNNPNAKGTCGCGESFHVWALSDYNFKYNDNFKQTCQVFLLSLRTLHPRILRTPSVYSQAFSRLTPKWIHLHSLRPTPARLSPQHPADTAHPPAPPVAATRRQLLRIADLFVNSTLLSFESETHSASNWCPSLSQAPPRRLLEGPRKRGRFSSDLWTDDWCR